MGLRLRITLMLPLVALLGCGSSPSSNSSGLPPVTYSLSGNWGAYGPINNPTQFQGALQVSNGVVTGTMTPLVYIPHSQTLLGDCPIQESPIAVTGTIDASGDLAVSLPLGGSSSNGVATITATIPADPQTLVTGSYQIVGGPCATPPTAITVAQYAPVTGTYTGTLNLCVVCTKPPPSTALTLTAVLTQSTSPDSTGSEFSLTARVNATSATCSLTNVPFPDETVSGHSISAIYLWGLVDPTASTIDASFEWNGCGGGGTYQGTLTRQ